MSENLKNIRYPAPAPKESLDEFPIGQVVLWNENLDGILPEWFVKANGQILNDIQSPLHNTALPNYNGVQITKQVSFVNNSRVVTMDTTRNIYIGANIEAGPIPSGTTITEILDETSARVSANATSTTTATTNIGGNRVGEVAEIPHLTYLVKVKLTNNTKLVKGYNINGEDFKNFQEAEIDGATDFIPFFQDSTNTYKKSPYNSPVTLRMNPTVTVGPGGDYATINEALEYLSEKYYPIYRKFGTKATIELLEGFYMQEQVLVNDVDLGWIHIISSAGDDPLLIQSFDQGTELPGSERPEISRLIINNYSVGIASDASVLNGNNFSLQAGDLSEHYFWFNSPSYARTSFEGLTVRFDTTGTDGNDKSVDVSIPEETIDGALSVDLNGDVIEITLGTTDIEQASAVVTSHTFPGEPEDPEDPPLPYASFSVTATAAGDYDGEEGNNIQIYFIDSGSGNLSASYEEEYDVFGDESLILPKAIVVDFGGDVSATAAEIVTEIDGITGFEAEVIEAGDFAEEDNEGTLATMSGGHDGGAADASKNESQIIAGIINSSISGFSATGSAVSVLTENVYNLSGGHDGIADPGLTGTGHEIELLVDDALATTVEKTNTVIDALPQFSSTFSNNVVTIENEENGPVNPISRNGTRISVATSQEGQSAIYRTLVNALGHTFEEGQRVVISNHVGITEEVDYNGRWIVVNPQENTFELEDTIWNPAAAGIPSTAFVTSPLNVPVSREHLTETWEFFYKPAFGVCRGTLPTIGCVFEMDETGDNPYMSYKDGLCATDQGRINLLPFSGFENAGGTNIYGTRNSLINANDCIANRGKRYGIWAFASTIINARRAEVNDCGFGAYEIGEVTVDESRNTSGVIDVIPRENDFTFPVGEPTTDGLEAYYEFDGDFTDSSGNGNDASSTNPPTVEEDGLVENINSISFNGTSNYLQLVSHNFITEIENKQFTFSLWVKFDSNMSDHNVIIATGDSSGQNRFILSRHNTSGEVGVLIRKNGSQIISQGIHPEDIGYGMWHNIVIVWDDETRSNYFRFYINNNPSIVNHLSTEPPSWSGVGNLVLGSNAEKNSGFFLGELAQPRIYDRALSEQEVLDLYRIPGLLTLNLEGYYPFTGGSADDASGNGNDGTIVGSPQLVVGPSGADALEFDGENDYFDANFSPDGLNVFSVYLWVKVNSFGGNQVFFGSGTESNYSFLSTRTNNRFSVGIGDKSWSNNDFIEFEELEEDVWYNIVTIFQNPDSGVFSAKFFLNGSFIKEFLASGSGGFEDRSHIFGAFQAVSGAVDFFNGKIAEPRIYSRALTEEEIKFLYLNPTPVITQEANVAAEKALDLATQATRGAIEIDNRYFRDNFTLSTWVWRHRDYNLPDGRILDKSDDEDGSNGFYLSVSNTGDLSFRVNAGVTQTVENVIPEETWTHVLVSVEQQHIRYFINGELELTLPNEYELTDINSNIFLAIGNAASRIDKGFRGYIEEVRIYDFILNPYQLTEIYEHPVDDTFFYSVTDEAGNPIGNGVYATRSSIINASESKIVGSFADNVVSEFGSSVNLDSVVGAEDVLQRELDIRDSYYGENVRTVNAATHKDGVVFGMNIGATIKKIG